MSNQIDAPGYDREDLAKAIFRMESRLHNIDDTTGTASVSLGSLQEAVETMKELALDVRGHYVSNQVVAQTELSRHLRHIKLLLFVIAFVGIVKLFA